MILLHSQKDIYARLGYLLCMVVNKRHICIIRLLVIGPELLIYVSISKSVIIIIKRYGCFLLSSYIVLQYSNTVFEDPLRDRK